LSHARLGYVYGFFESHSGCTDKSPKGGLRTPRQQNNYVDNIIRRSAMRIVKRKPNSLLGLLLFVLVSFIFFVVAVIDMAVA